MAVRRAVVSGIGLAVAALLLSACGTNPMLPPTVALTSPYHGSSTLDLLDQTGRQTAKVRVCSLAGGPLTVDVHIAAPTSNTDLSVRAYSTDGEVTHDPVDSTLFESILDGAPTDTHFESTRPMRPGECADVFLSTTEFLGDPGLPYTFTITW